MFSSNILSFYLEQYVSTVLNDKRQSSALTLDTHQIVEKYYTDIVNHAYEQATDSYNKILDKGLKDDQPKSYDEIFDIIIMCRVAVMEKYLQISEEAQSTSLFKEKKALLLKSIKEKEISTLQINEQLSNQHCQFIQEKLQFE